MYFVIIFAVLGLFAIPCILMFAFCGDNKKNKLTGIIVVICFWSLFAFAISEQDKTNDKMWNDGFCECGTHWELRGTTHNKTTRTKPYACPNCYEEISLVY